MRVTLPGATAGTVDPSRPARILGLGGEDLVAPPGRRPRASPGAAARASTASTAPVGVPPGTAAARRSWRRRAVAADETVPYSAVIYWIDGGSWVYTQTGPLTFVRAPIVIDEVDGDVAVLKSGPAGRHRDRERRRPGAARHRVPDRRASDAPAAPDDALDRQVEPAVPLHRRRAGGGDDGARGDARARHAGRRLPRVRAAVRRGADRGARHVDRGGRAAHHDPDGAVAELDAGARHDALEDRPGPVGDHALLQARHRQPRGPPARERARRDRDPEPAGVGGHPVGAAAALGHEPRAEDRPHVRPLRA